LTGDLERQGEKELSGLGDYVKSDVLKLGHHGSKTSSTREFLKQADPRFAVISVAAKNHYKHPSKEVLERLDSLGIKYCKTSDDGSVRVKFSQKGYSVDRYKAHWR